MDALRALADTRSLHARLAEVRAISVNLIAPLTPEDCCVQSMPDCSPAKWHLAHTTWFFENFVLAEFERRYAPYEPQYRFLFNSYYDAIGARHPRPQRGLLTRPSLDEVLDYRAEVDDRLAALLVGELPPRALALLELGVQHEQQHQELLLTDVKHLLSCNPLAPAYRAERAPPAAEPLRPLGWNGFDGGRAEIGIDAPAVGGGFAFDNESPRHAVWLQPFALADRLVSNGEFAAFVDDGGYRQPQWWLAEGWDWLQREQIGQPAYWRGGEDSAGRRREFTLGGEVPLDPGLPACHLSYHEADAYARWAGARLPTEAEWEHAAGSVPVRGNFLDADLLHPAAPGRYGTQMFGDAWEWTASSYTPYPGFAPAPGAVGEYNGKFMVNQYVLRGGSCATPAGHLRPSYRNFFPATARWQFSGLRLARSL